VIKPLAEQPFTIGEVLDSLEGLPRDMEFRAHLLKRGKPEEIAARAAARELDDEMERWGQMNDDAWREVRQDCS
jgi:hypothetical protein